MRAPISLLSQRQSSTGNPKIRNLEVGILELGSLELGTLASSAPTST
jgi:hypothetical protein